MAPISRFRADESLYRIVIKHAIGTQTIGAVIAKRKYGVRSCHTVSVLKIFINRSAVAGTIIEGMAMRTMDKSRANLSDWVLRKIGSTDSPHSGHVVLPFGRSMPVRS